MATEECRGCRYSKSYGRTLLCRRYPPSAAGKWPNVGPTEWCGEFMGHRPGTDLPVKAPAPRLPSESPREDARRLRDETARDFDEDLMPGGFP